MSNKKVLLLLLVIAILFSGCITRDDSTRLESKEVLYSFVLDAAGCTDLTGRGMIEDASPKQVFEALSNAKFDFGYISIVDKKILVDLPWPYSDIEESVSVSSKEFTLVFTGSDKVKTLVIKTVKFQTGTLVTISGTMCIDMPTFLRENVLSSFIKEIVRNLRDQLE
ncbi:hypothetical protein KAH37_03930 [bacterium]|nr:hypothetical protein [bacterium]